MSFSTLSEHRPLDSSHGSLPCAAEHGVTGSFRFPPGPFTTSLDYPRYPAGRAIALTAGAGLVGLYHCHRVGSGAGASLLSAIWSRQWCGNLSLLACSSGVCSSSSTAAQPWPLSDTANQGVGLSARPAGRSRKAMVGLGVGVILFVPFLFLGTSAGNPSAYGPVHHVGLALVLAQLLVCYPLTVVAEEDVLPRMAPTSARTVGAYFVCIARVRLPPRTVAHDSLSDSTWTHSRRRVLVDGKREDVQCVALPQQRQSSSLSRTPDLAARRGSWPTHPAPMCRSGAGNISLELTRFPGASRMSGVECQ